MRLSRALSIGTTSALVAMLALTIASAQTSEDLRQNTIRIEAGQILEVGTDSASTKSEFSWILTKDHKFQNAQRTRFFSTRPAQTGVYVLDVSIQDPLLNKNDYRAFTIAVTDPSPLPPPIHEQSGSPKAILQTIPAAIDGTIYLPPEGGMISIESAVSTGTISSYSLDLDSTIDSNGDGDPSNDHDNQDTYAERSGVPLWYYLLPSVQSRTIALVVTNAATGEMDRTTLMIAFTPPPPPRPQAPPSNQSSEIALRGSGMTVQVAPRLTDTNIAGRELLYEWDFGDQRRSLLTHATHTYTVPGTFGITLTVRDLQNGETIFTGTQTVTIQPTIESQPSNTSSGGTASSAGSNQAGSAQPSSFGSIFKVLMIIVLLLGLAIGLYCLFQWMKRKTGGHLEKALESMEKNIVKSAGPAPEIKIEPLKIKKETPVATMSVAADDLIDREKSKTEFTKPSRESATPITSTAPVPSWLAKASTLPQTTPPPPPKPTATPTPTPIVPTPTPTPAVTSSVTSPATAPVPDWLKQAPKSVQTPVAVPPAPTPVKAPAPIARPVVAPIVQTKPAAPLLAPLPTPKVGAAATAPKLENTEPKSVQTRETSAPALSAKQPSEMQKQTAAAALPKPPTPSKQAPVTTAPIMKDIPASEVTSSLKPQASNSLNDTDPPIAFIQADSLTKK